MAPQRWTTEEQFQWLVSWGSSFRQHREAGTLSRFWPEVGREWFKVFPERNTLYPDFHGPLTEDEAAALDKAIGNRAKRLRNWFNNKNGQKARRAESARVDLNILKPRGRRALQATEVYSRKYYKDRVKPLVDDALKSGDYDKTARLNLIKRLTRETYEDESPEIKAEVEAEVLAARQELVESSDEGGDGDNEERDATPASSVNAVYRQAAVDNLPAMLRQLFAELRRRTGWYFYTVGAGLNDEGRVSSMAFHEEGSNAVDFGMSTPDFRGNFVRPFIEHVKDLLAMDDTGEPLPADDVAPNVPAEDQPNVNLGAIEAGEAIAQNALPSVSSPPSPASEHDAMLPPAGPNIAPSPPSTGLQPSAPSPPASQEQDAMLPTAVASSANTTTSNASGTGEVNEDAVQPNNGYAAGPSTSAYVDDEYDYSLLKDLPYGGFSEFNPDPPRLPPTTFSEELMGFSQPAMMPKEMGAPSGVRELNNSATARYATPSTTGSLSRDVFPSPGKPIPTWNMQMYSFPSHPHSSSRLAESLPSVHADAPLASSSHGFPDPSYSVSAARPAMFTQATPSLSVQSTTTATPAAATLSAQSKAASPGGVRTYDPSASSSQGPPHSSPALSAAPPAPSMPAAASVQSSAATPTAATQSARPSVTTPDPAPPASADNNVPALSTSPKAHVSLPPIPPRGTSRSLSAAIAGSYLQRHNIERGNHITSPTVPSAASRTVPSLPATPAQAAGNGAAAQPIIRSDHGTPSHTGARPPRSSPIGPPESPTPAIPPPTQTTMNKQTELRDSPSSDPTAADSAPADAALDVQTQGSVAGGRGRRDRRAPIQPDGTRADGPTIRAQKKSTDTRKATPAGGSRGSGSSKRKAIDNSAEEPRGSKKRR
ncbi:hypothetical protein EVJ58_g6971 [Rhodofomes roseus]|uniref:Uncharacterized protein n=1 Tax=Rhodofomes roseus TaxID=34475 RepID=A0A4Y9Y4U4_9APHY|nr:hypothetical protein EVJ58_g6971 [Rhodofomes roseus]